MQSLRIDIHQGIGVAVLVEVPGEGDGILDVLVTVGREEAGIACIVVSVNQVVVAGFGVKLTAQPTFPAFGRNVK